MGPVVYEPNLTWFWSPYF